MAVFSFSLTYRLLAIVITFLLILIHDVKLSSSLKIQQSQNRSHHVDSSENPKYKERIEAFVIPIVSVNSTGHSNHSRNAKAEVKILMSSLAKSPDPLREGLIRASSIVMDYEEDTRKYLRDDGNPQRNASHRIRHSSHRHDSYNPVQDDYTAANDAPQKENDSHPISSNIMSASNVEPQVKIRIPVRALIYARDDASFAPRRTHGNRGLNINKNDTWVALHSPVKIFIPVKNDNGEGINSIDISNKCVQCPANMTIIAERRKITAEVPVPPISVCSHLARRRGRLNVAVITGPRPGTKVKEGDHPVKIIVWKHGGHVYSCEYVLSVIVRKCEENQFPNGFHPPDWKHFTLNHLSANCSDTNLWGSKCNFYCSPNYVLQGEDSVICEANSEKISWTSSFPVCKSKKSLKKEIVAAHTPTVSKLPCPKLSHPHDGIVVCSNADSKNLYPDGSVCQYFCHPGFYIENLFTNDALVVCKNGEWTPNNNITCLASYCSEPKLPQHGSIRCEGIIKDSTLHSQFVKSTYKNGTTCTFYCDSGFTIPKSQRHLEKMVCQAPSWQSLSSPECKRIKIPQPYSKDCKDLVLVANQRGVAKIKPPKFLLSEDSSIYPKTYIFGNCTYKGKLQIGTYINNCSAYDDELNATSYCTYSVIVKENTCSIPPAVSHSHIECNNLNNMMYPKKTVCKYICNDGFVIPKKQRKFKSRQCTSKLEWKPILVPSCKKAVPPKPRKNSCLPQVLFLKANSATVKLKLPKFRSSLKGSKVKVNCTLKGHLTAGNYTNLCEALDTQLTLTSTCMYSITVKESECDVLPIASRSFIDCTFPESKPLYSPGTICSYKCHEGFVIPTSFLPYSTKLCNNHGTWNNTIIPDCLPQLVPVPADHSCLDSTINVDDLENFAVPIPQFKSFSGADLNITCKPTTIEVYSTHVINCSAYDPQFRSVGVCSFQLDVYNPNQVAQFQQAERGCTALRPIKNGNLSCNYTLSNVMPLQTLCEVLCYKNYIIPAKELNFSVSMCTDEGTWNVSQIPDCVRADPPFLISGCTSETLKVSNPADVRVPLPQFLTLRNTSANVSCFPEILEAHETYNVECTAVDIELGTTVSCSYYVTLEKDDSIYEQQMNTTPSSIDNFTVPFVENFTSTSIEDFTETTSEEQFKDCKPIVSPLNGIINCSLETPIKKCAVNCETGFAFPSTYTYLQKGLIECDGTDGLWDFERFFNSPKLPECLVVLQNTTAIVSFHFNAFVEKCDGSDESFYQKTIKDILLPLNDHICDMIDCTALMVKCSNYSFGNRIALTVNWTLQSAYDPFEEGVPAFEDNFDTVFDATKKAVQQDDWFKEKLLLAGIQLNQTSFTKSYIVLACAEDGYGIDLSSNKCIACPSGTMEQNNECVPCLSGYYQLQSRQTTCNICPEKVDHIRIDLPPSCLSN